MGRSTRGRLAAFALAAFLLTSCGVDPADQDLCARYTDLKAAVADLRAAPRLDGTDAEVLQGQVDEMRLQADKVRDALDQIQRVSEGRLDTAIGNARASVDDMRESLIVARYDAAETLGPRIAEAQANLSGLRAGGCSARHAVPDVMNHRPTTTRKETP